MSVVGVAEDIRQHEMAVGTAHERFTPLRVERRRISFFFDGIECHIGGGYCAVVTSPKRIGRVLIFFLGILPVVALLFGKLVVTVGRATIIRVIAVKLEQFVGRHVGIRRYKQFGYFLVGVQLRTVVRHFVQKAVAGDGGQT